jgi:predicted nucleotidyltransferase
MSDIFDQRRAYSLDRITELTSAIDKLTEPIELADLTIFTVGSYGRLEASSHSDIDLFFVYGPSDASKEQRRTNELRLFGRLIEKVADLGFPKLSNDAQYLQSHEAKKVLKHLGSAVDDSRNYFTTRMLLLLESRSLYGDASYNHVVKAMLDSYYRDYPTHEENFRPWFLLNDIMRFWKTLLLNYENKRNRADDPSDPKPRVKNFKLKYSRATTCFATICAVGASSGPVGLHEMVDIVSVTPRERLLRVAVDMPQLEDAVARVLDDYAWFLEKTGLPTEELEGLFVEKQSKTEMFARASDYGQKLFSLLQQIDANSKSPLMRVLVV